MAAHIAGVYVVYMSRLFFALSHLMITLSLFPPLEFQQWYDHRVDIAVFKGLAHSEQLNSTKCTERV